ncbi:MAG: SAF domain-containing protein [Acidimicrobiales bacterium]|jgi:hypothetical protein
MSALTDTISGRRQAEDGPAAVVRPPTGRRDRRTLLVVASVALICASIAAFSGLYSSADQKTPAVVLVRSVAQGQAITSADLGEADVSVSNGVGFIPVSEASLIAGKRAASAVPRGSLLTLADLTGAPGIEPGDAVVGVALKDGSYPASGLDPGDQVMVVQTASPGAVLASPTTEGISSGTANPDAPGVVGATTVSQAPAGTGVLVPRASVVSAGLPNPDSSGGYSLLVSVEVTSSVAAEVATAATAGQVSLVLLPAGSTVAPNATTGSGAAPAGTVP